MVSSEYIINEIHNITRQNLKTIQWYLHNARRILNQHTTVIKSCDTVLNSRLTKELFDCVKYLLTPWCRVLLEKLTGLQLVKKFPAFHGTRRFITLLTSARHLFLSWANPIQSTYPHPTSWRSILLAAALREPAL